MTSGRLRAAGIYGGVLLLGLWTIIPLYWLLVLSLTPPGAPARHPTPLPPLPPTAANYAWLLAPDNGQAELVRQGFANSLFVALVTALLVLLVVTPGAYALSRQPRIGQGLLASLLITRAYPPVALALPIFWLFARHGLIGTRHGLIMAYVGLTAPLVIWLLVGVFAGLPPAVLDAARVDGNTPWQVFHRVAVPLARPGITLAGVVAFVGCWNEFALAQFLAAGSPAQMFPQAVAPLLAAMPHELAAASVIGLAPAVALAILSQRLLGALSLPAPVES